MYSLYSKSAKNTMFFGYMLKNLYLCIVFVKTER